MAVKPGSEIPLTPRNIVFSALDIAAHPHPDGVYVKLFQKAFSLKRAIKISGYEYAELSPLRYNREDGVVKWITGHVYRFVHIDDKEPWFNREIGEIIAPSESKKHVSIPKNWSPNTRRIFFAFNVENHILVFARKNATATFSPKQAANYFQELMSAACEEVAGPDTVEVTTIKDAHAINRIFEKHRVARLEIELRKPNPDASDEAYAAIYKQLKEENLQKKVEILTAVKGQSIHESKRIRRELDATLRCGSANAITYDENDVKEEIDTENHPIEETHHFNPERKIAFIGFISMVAVDILATILKGRK